MKEKGIKMSKNNTKNKFAKAIIVLVVLAMLLPIVAVLFSL